MLTPPPSSPQFVKISKMTSGLPYSSVLRSITASKGLPGLLDGFLPWGVLQSLGKGAAFGVAFAVASPLLLGLADEGRLPERAARVLAGGLAGGVQGYVLSPLLLLKTRVMTDAAFREAMPLRTTVARSFAVGGKVLRADGALGLMKGSNTFAFKRVFDWATRYLFAELCEQLLSARLGGAALSPGQKMLASLVGGGFSAVATLPLDTLLSKIQDAKNSGNAGSAFDMVRADYEAGGWGGLWGQYMVAWEARCLHVGLTTVALKTWTPMLFERLFE